MKIATIVLLSTIIGAVLIGAFVSAIAFTHVDRYYVSSTRTAQVSSVTCAWAHWTGWHLDEIAYCSDDASKVIDWVAKANASLR
jgi:hypothetical protein